MAMGLASMNPVAGSATGALMIKSKPEKDEVEGWSSYGVARGFDSNGRIAMTKDGRLTVKSNKDLNECAIYVINSFGVDEIFNKLLDEAMMNDDDKPIHEDPGFIYSVFTGNYLLTEDQADYDPLLERVYLDKLSKRLSGDATNLETEYSTRELNKKDSHYPLEEKRIGDEEDGSIKFPMLASARLNANLDKIQEVDNYITSILSGGEEIVEDI